MDRIAEIAKSHWMTNESDEDHAERVERCIVEAHSFFDAATTQQLAQHRQTMADIMPYAGSPKWDRMKAAASKVWADSTFPARELFLVTFEELMRDGEISEATSAMWDELLPAKVIPLRPVVPAGYFDHPAQPLVAQIMSAAE